MKWHFPVLLVLSITLTLLVKGPSAIWAFFGFTLWIDVITHMIYPKKEERINPYKPVREVSVLVPAHKEPEEYVEETIKWIYKERYPIKNVIICGDSESEAAQRCVERLRKIYKNLHYIESPNRSKAKKINYVANKFSNLTGEFVYVRDCRVKGEKACIEKMMSYFNDEKVAAVTSHGRVTIPKNFLSRSYSYGKVWINEIGRFRKNAQEKRRAVFVICGASTIFRADVLRKIPVPARSKTEDTHYTWILQKHGYKVRVADDATVSSPEVDGKGLLGIKGQIRQAYRWSVGNMQCMFLEGTDLLKNKRFYFTTLIPGFVEAFTYTIGLLLTPLFLFLVPEYAIGFLIGDTFFSLIGTVVILPEKFFKTLFHYPQIMFFKYLNCIIFIAATASVTFEALTGKMDRWSNEWHPPETRLI